MFERDSVEKILEKNKSIQAEFLNFLDKEENFEGNFKNLNKIFDETKIREYQYDIRLFYTYKFKISMI